eukprot:scaffold3932_cov87-Cyclotella_meneghiniana.AAC.26
MMRRWFFDDVIMEDGRGKVMRDERMCQNDETADKTRRATIMGGGVHGTSLRSMMGEMDGV